jgi:hypothetical protein
MAFTTAQNVQVNRLPAAYFKSPGGSDMTDAAYKSMAEGKLEKLTVNQLRARVNVTGVLGSSSRIANYSAENDYSAAEMEAITRALQVGGKWGEQVADAVAAGPDLTQRVETLERA